MNCCPTRRWTPLAVAVLLGVLLTACLESDVAGPGGTADTGTTSQADLATDTGPATDSTPTDVGSLDVGQDTSPPDSGMPDLGSPTDMAADTGSPDLVADTGGEDVQVDSGSDLGVDVSVDMSDPGPGLPPRYALGRRHSPITESVVDAFEAIADNSDQLFADRFMLVGDSISAENRYLECFTGETITVLGRPELEETYAYFRESLGEPVGPLFERQGYAVLGGRTASWAITVNANGAAPECSDTTPLLCEHDEVLPQLALVMMGTNDIGYPDPDETRANIIWMFNWWSDKYIALLDNMLELGIVPIVWTIPPRTINGFREDYVPAMNLLIRALAEARQIPLIDFYSDLFAFGPPYSLADGVHLTSAGSGGCDLSSDALVGGINLQNLVALEALDRVRRAFGGAVAPDVNPGPGLVGEGTAESPYEISSLPFWHAGNTVGWQQSQMNSYPACHDNDQNESGPEVIYRFETDARVRIRVLVVDGDGPDLDIHVIQGDLTVDNCIARDDQLLEGALDAGVYHFVVDTFEGNAGEYAFAVEACGDDQPQCDGDL